MDRLKKNHVSIKEGRCIGLFGMVDLQKNSRGEELAPYNGSHPAMGKLNKFYNEYTLLNQAFIKDEKKTVRQYLEDIDKILRIDSEENIVLIIIDLLNIHNYSCQELEWKTAKKQRK